MKWGGSGSSLMISTNCIAIALGQDGIQLPREVDPEFGLWQSDAQNDFNEIPSLTNMNILPKKRTPASQYADSCIMKVGR